MFHAFENQVITNIRSWFSVEGPNDIGDIIELRHNLSTFPYNLVSMQITVGLVSMHVKVLRQACLQPVFFFQQRLQLVRFCVSEKLELSLNFVLFYHAK